MKRIFFKIDFSALKKQLETDDICMKYLQSLYDNLPTQSRQLKKAFTNKQYEQCGDIAHSIKGATGYLGFEELENNLLRLERYSFEVPNDQALFEEALQNALKMIKKARNSIHKHLSKVAL